MLIPLVLLPQYYGEAEFWFSLIKISAIVGLIILGAYNTARRPHADLIESGFRPGIILDAGGGPNHDAIGFRYWRNPGPFNSQTFNGGDSIIGGSWGKFLA